VIDKTFGKEGEVSQHLGSILELWKEGQREISTAISGGSMLPLIRAGDRVLIRPLDHHRIRIGDVFAFFSGSHITVHRLLMKRQAGGSWWFCEKGDSLLHWAWIPESRVIGRIETVHKQNNDLRLTEWPWNLLHPLCGCWMLLYTLAMRMGKACLKLR
jgi:hypothetical protein